MRATWRSEAPGGKIEDCFYLIARQPYLKVDEFVYGNAVLQILEYRSYLHPCVAENPCAANLAWNALHGRAPRPIERAQMAAGGIRQGVKSLGKEIVHILDPPAPDAFADPAFKLWFLDFDAHCLFLFDRFKFG
jgi:hypothetical protein